MKIWSKGLGRMVLKMDFKNYYVEIDKKTGALLIKGKITDPVLWNFIITIAKEDIPGLTNIAFKSGLITYFLSNIPGIAQFFIAKIFARSNFKHPEKNIEMGT